MDCFIAKLNEFGLEAREPSEKREVLNTIEKEANHITWLQEPISKMEEIISNRVYLVIKNKKKFIKKMNLTEQIKGKPLFVLENFQLEIDLEEKMFFFAEYDLDDYGDKEITEHIFKNLAHYEELFPEWKMGRMFDKNKFDGKLIKKMFDQRDEFKESATENVSFHLLYEELAETIEKQLRKEKEWQNGFVY